MMMMRRRHPTTGTSYRSIPFTTIVAFTVTMKFVSVASLLVLAASASAFVPSVVPLRTCVSLEAKHANDKAAKKANANRPRKSRPSDIKRKPTNYPTWDKPPEYTISEN
ncbi:hypothetical protein ACHAXH_005034 [Discostella pseudostelligera]